MAFIWHLNVIHFNEKTLLRGVLLDGNPPKHRKKVSSFKHFTIVIRSYFRRPLSETKAVVSNGEQNYEVITDDKGSFSLEISQWTGNELMVYLEGSREPLELFQEYPVEFQEKESRINAISDLDDTLMVSYTASFWKRVKTLLFVPPRKRKPVYFTTEILKSIKDAGGQIFYISKSESNLFGIIYSVIQKHQLPSAPIFLTPYLKNLELLNPGKAKDYKEKRIREIFRLTGDKKFVLIGDDTQADILVYLKMAEQYPEKIVKVFIRRTSKSLSRKKEESLERIKNKNISLTYFTSSDDVSKEINSIINQ